MSAELTPAERAVAEVLLRQYNSEYDATFLTPANFDIDAREILVAVRPHIAAETLREAAGWLGTEHFAGDWLRRRADAIEARQS